MVQTTRHLLDLCKSSKFYRAGMGNHGQPHIWNPRPHIAYSLCNFHGATMVNHG